MAIAPVTATTPGTTPRPGSGVTSDYTTFLRMLTAQMQNQNPLNPIESSDYAVQLATFSGVEQQTRTNQLLEALGGQFTVMSLSQLANWVGREALVEAPVWVAGHPVTLSPSPVAQADRAVLVVRNATGELIARQDVPPVPGPLDWRPLDMAGTPVPAGSYSFTLENYRNDELLTTLPVSAYAAVTEVRAGPQGITLVLTGGAEVLAADVSALRMAEE